MQAPQWKPTVLFAVYMYETIVDVSDLAKTLQKSVRQIFFTSQYEVDSTKYLIK